MRDKSIRKISARGEEMNTAQARQDIADRAVAKMRAEGFERRIPNGFCGNPEELQRDYALEWLLGYKPRGERRDIKPLERSN
jgi:hypothetical protein